jgi:hypothetical protein
MTPCVLTTRPRSLAIPPVGDARGRKPAQRGLQILARDRRATGGRARGPSASIAVYMCVPDMELPINKQVAQSARVHVSTHSKPTYVSSPEECGSTGCLSPAAPLVWREKVYGGSNVGGTGSSPAVGVRCGSLHCVRATWDLGMRTGVGWIFPSEWTLPRSPALGGGFTTSSGKNGSPEHPAAAAVSRLSLGPSWGPAAFHIASFQNFPPEWSRCPSRRYLSDRSVPSVHRPWLAGSDVNEHFTNELRSCLLNEPDFDAATLLTLIRRLRHELTVCTDPDVHLPHTCSNKGYNRAAYEGATAEKFVPESYPSET